MDPLPLSPPSCRPPSWLGKRYYSVCLGSHIVLSMAKPCELCDALHAELDSARVEATALHQDRSARVADTNAPRRAALFTEAMRRWYIAASNLEYHCIVHTIGNSKNNT
jgi:hypothetical protein